jgi:hypothetical protein
MNKVYVINGLLRSMAVSVRTSGEYTVGFKENQGRYEVRGTTY